MTLIYIDVKEAILGLTDVVASGLSAGTDCFGLQMRK